MALWVALGAAWGACTSTPTPPPGSSSGLAGSDIGMTRIFESKRPYPHHLTYYLASLEQEGDEVTLYLDIMNGFSRYLNGVTLWITLLSETGERSDAYEHPMGPMRPQSTDHAIFEVSGVPFPVDDLEVGVQVNP